MTISTKEVVHKMEEKPEYQELAKMNSVTSVACIVHVLPSEGVISRQLSSSVCPPSLCTPGSAFTRSTEYTAEGEQAAPLTTYLLLPHTGQCVQIPYICLVPL